jgi:hypothetical protein
MEYEKENGPSAGTAGAVIGKYFNNAEFSPFPPPIQPGELTVATIQKGKWEIVRVNLFRMQENNLLGIGVFAQLETDTVVPTKRGLALAIRHNPTLREALQLAEAQIACKGEAGGAA